MNYCHLTLPARPRAFRQFLHSLIHYVPPCIDEKVAQAILSPLEHTCEARVSEIEHAQCLQQAQRYGDRAYKRRNETNTERQSVYVHKMCWPIFNNGVMCFVLRYKEIEVAAVLVG